MLRFLSIFCSSIALWAVSLGVYAQDADTKKLILDDVYLKENSDRLEFGNCLLRLEIEKKTGQWVGLYYHGTDENWIQSTPDMPTIDFQVQDEWMIQRYGANYSSHQVQTDSVCVSLNVLLEVSSEAWKSNLIQNGPDDKGQHEFQVVYEYTLYPRSGRLQRSARVVVNTSRQNESSYRFQQFSFSVPGAVIADASDCTIDAPGPFWPNNYVPADSPYGNYTERSIGFHSAPDGGFGLVIISNPKENLTMGSWMETRGEVGYGTRIVGDQGRIGIVHDDRRAVRIDKAKSIQSDVQVLEIAKGGVPEMLARYQKSMEETLPLPEKTPDWVNDAVILEVMPSYFPEGLKGLQKKLPFYKEIGINTIYLMPHWVGGYSPIDFYAVNPKVGTEEDLKAVVQAAHELGMRFLFDMVIHGVNEKSLMQLEFPEYFVKDEQGNLTKHSAWKSITFDWASPAYHDFMRRLVEHDVTTYGIDGYRVDAASYKSPNWSPEVPYPAYRSGSYAPAVMRVMLETLQRHNPEAVLLSEVFGPVFQSVCNLTHDNQTEGPQYFLEQMDLGNLNAQHYQAHMANVFDMLQSGANRVFYARNHDTSWFYHFNGYTERFLNLDAVHAFFGIPSIFAGDPKNGPHPDDDSRVFDFYKKVLAARKRFPELIYGERNLRDVRTNNPNVFAGIREIDKEITIVLISFSENKETALLQSSNYSFPRTMEWYDVNQEERVNMPLREAFDPCPVTLEPFQILLGKIPVTITY